MESNHSGNPWNKGKLRGRDLVNLHVHDITHGNQILARAMVVQRKTQRLVQFELTEPTRSAVFAWIEKGHLKAEQHLFPRRIGSSPHVSTRQYARIVHQWIASIGLDSSVYGTHMDFTRFSRHMIMSKLNEREVNERRQIHG